MKRFMVLLSLLLFVSPAFAWQDTGGGGVAAVGDSLSALRENTHFDTLSTDSLTVIGSMTQVGAQTVTGTVSATAFVGDGSGLTGVGAAAATSLSIAAKAAENIDIGEAVYVSAASSDKVEVSLADNTDAAKSHFWGLAAETKTTGQTISVRIAGLLGGLNTSAFSAGDDLWLSTAGALTATKPTSGALIRVGYVSSDHATTGEIVFTKELEPFLAAASGEDIDLRMGDDIGGTKVEFENYSDEDVGWIDSQGLAAFSTGLSITNIRSGTGAVSFNNDNLVTTGTLGAGATTVTTLVTSGDVGVGATPNANWARTALEVDDAAASNIINQSGTIILGTNVYFDGSNNRYANNGTSAFMGIAGSVAEWYFSTASGTAGAIASYTTAASFDISGMNGVLGATTPAAATVTTLESTFSAEAHTVGLRLSNTSVNAYGNDLAWYTGYGSGYDTAKIQSVGQGSFGGALSFWTANTSKVMTERVTITNAGNVGIGTAAPSSALDVRLANVAGDNKLAGQFINADTDNGYGLFVKAGDNADVYALQVQDVSANVLFEVQGDGAVGIGTAAPSDYLTNYNNLVVANAAGSSGITLAANSSNDSRILFADGTSGDARNAGQIIYTHSTDALSFHTAISQRMLLDASGNLGIGTASPSVTLDVEGTSAVNGDARTVLQLTDDTAMAAGVGGGIFFGGYYDGSNTTDFGAIWGEKENGTSGNYAGQLHLGTRVNGGSFSSDLIIDSSGNLGLGGAPTYHFHSIKTGVAYQNNIVIDNAQTAADGVGSNITFVGDSGGQNMATIRSSWTGAANTDARLQFLTRQSGTETLAATIDNAGNLGLGTSVPHALFEAQASSNAITQIHSKSDASSTYAALRFKTANDGDADNYTKGGIFFINNGSGSGVGDMKFLVDSNVDNGNVDPAADVKMTLSQMGNLGLGVTPEATWPSTWSAMQLGGQMTFSNTTTPTAGSAASIGCNVYYDSGNSRWEHIIEDEVALYIQTNGTHAFYTAVSAVADSAAVIGTAKLTIANDGYVTVALDPVDSLGVANRGWVLAQMAAAGAGTVTNIASGAGLTGGPITTTGTLALTGNALALHNLAVTDGNIAVGNGATWVAESGATARTSLGAQAQDAELDNIAAMAPTLDNFIVGDGNDFIKVSPADARTAMSAQTVDAGLTDIASLATTDDNIIVGSGSNWVAESGATARASLDAQQADSDLDALATAGFSGTGAFARVAVTAGAIPYGDGSKLALTAGGGTDGYVLTTNGAGSAPTWESKDAGFGSIAYQDSDAVHITGGKIVNLDSLLIGSATPTLKENLTVQGDMALEDTAPLLTLYETGGSSNEKRWAIGADGDQFDFRLLNDAGTSPDTAMTITRSGAAITAVEFPHSVNVFGGRLGNLGAPVVSKSLMAIDADAPSLLIYEADGSADEKLWSLTANGERLLLTAWEDDLADSTSALIIRRVGTEPYVSSFMTKLFVATQVPALGGIAGSANFVVNGDAQIESSNPGLLLYESDETSDEKLWGIDASGSVLDFSVYEDDGTAEDPWMRVFRSSAVPTKVAITAGIDVGIGTESPSAELHLYDTAAEALTFLVQHTGDEVANIHLANSGGFSILGLTSDADEIANGTTANATVLESSGTRPIEFATRDTVQVRIETDGDVYLKKALLVGTTGGRDVTGQWNVNTALMTMESEDASIIERSAYNDNLTLGDAIAKDYILAGTANNVVGIDTWIAVDSDEDGAALVRTMYDGGASSFHTFQANGDVVFGSTSSNSHNFRIVEGASYSEIDAGEASFSTSSSRALKKNLKLFRGHRRVDVWKAFQAFDVYNYHWKEDQRRKPATKVGPMADEFIAVSEALRPGEGVITEFNGNDMMMAQAIILQDLMKKVEQLEAKVQRQDQRITYLEGRQ